MPVSEYDRYFGRKKGAAAEAKQSMERAYGKEKGEQVFYATMNKRKAAPSSLPPRRK